MPAIRSDGAGTGGLNLTKESIAQLTTLTSHVPAWWSEDEQSVALNPPNQLVATIASGSQARVANIQPGSISTGTGNPGGSGVQHAPFGLEVGDSLNFIDTIDTVAYFGYNMASGGVKKIAAEPYLGYVVETDYNDGSTHKMEQYFEYKSMDGGISFRPLSFAYDRSQAGAGNTNASLSQASIMGNPFYVDSPDGTQLVMIGRATFRLLPNVAATDNGISLEAPSGSNAFGIWKTGATEVFRFATGSTTQGFLTMNNNAFGVMRWYNRNNTGGAIAVNVDDNAAALTVVGGTPQSGFTSSTSIVARAGTTQSADLFQTQDKNSVVLAKIDNTGKLTAKGLATSADPAGVASQVAFGVTNGIGNGAATNLQAPAFGTGSGPASLTVNQWIKAFNGTTAGWIPFFV